MDGIEAATALPRLEFLTVLGSRVDATSYDDAAERILGWARAGQSRQVCVAAVSTIMIGHDEPAFREITNRADLVGPDGMPLVWALRLLGVRQASRVRGTDLMTAVLSRASRAGIPVGFYGGAPSVVASLVNRVRTRWPGLDVSYACSPPFRELSLHEDERIVGEIAASRARILFVGLGCPKQERWMDAHRERIPAVMIGVGAAFDFLSGTKPEAPLFMQQAGLEWLFRLSTEPRRLWRRYLTQNPRFLWLIAGQAVRHIVRGS
jgi:N-acetylglucosaminyldiphosphoundecaprenol N-acetyl-beta-D-mannosaminyltransferase